MNFFVEGVRCSKCIGKIEGLKAQLPGVQTLEVDLANQMARVELSSASNSFGEVAEAINNLGFRAIPVRPDENINENWKKESRKDLIRLAVAAFCAGNIMSLAFATYFGLEGVMKRQFEWVQFFLYLPVVLYVAFPFYQGFVSGLRNRSLSIDGPMALASFLGFVVSTWNLFRGEGSIYYDSLSGFLFLILATRYFQKRTRFAYLKYLRPTSLAETFKARLVEGDSWSWVRSDQLKFNDVILVEAGEWIPADGKLLHSQAVMDLSVLNGESVPRSVQKNFPVKAGSRLLSNSVKISVEKSGSQTLLGHLLASIERDSFEDTGFARLSDKASQILLAIVLSLAAIVMVVGAFGNFETEFEKALALVILACPCAMAFGTPLAFSFSMKRAQDLGIIIKSAKVFEALSQIKTVFLDKTGTLTQRLWNLENSSLQIDPIFYKQIILALESQSQHPVAFALREIWRAVTIPEDMELSDYRETESRGVAGKILGTNWEFHPFFKDEKKWYGLYENGVCVWEFQLKSVLKPAALQTVSELQANGFNVALLSGDSKVETEKVAIELGISLSNVYSELTTQEKADIIGKAPKSLMVGDGVNDTLALQAASVGVAVKGGVDLALKSADVLFLKEGLGPLVKLLSVSETARKQIKRNLASALIYNVIGGVLALSGYVDPFVAALAMPVSSLYILGTTWWGTRK